MLDPIIAVLARQLTEEMVSEGMAGHRPRDQRGHALRPRAARALAGLALRLDPAAARRSLGA